VERSFVPAHISCLTMADYSPKQPNVQVIAYEDGQERVYEPMDIGSEEEGRHEILFRLPNHLVASVSTLSHLFLPDAFMAKVTRATNAYAKKSLSPETIKEVTLAEMFHFFAVIFYMGLVRLPAKEDYWRDDPSVWPSHPPCVALSSKRFKYIWRVLHLTQREEMVDVEDPILDEEEVMESDTELEAEEAVAVEMTVNDCDEEREVDDRWYAKAAPIIEQFLEVTKRLCVRPGTTLSIDEMMKLFKGRSGQTIRMKNKPIKEGYKFFAICDSSTGYVWDLIPDGRLVKTTIADTVLELVKSLPGRGDLKYVVGMDNYFTYPKILEGMRALGVGCTGTARFKTGWPPKEYRSIDDKRFNTVYLMNDAKNFLICRWIDNNVVTMVSTVHTGFESVERQRRRPRATANNRGHIDLVWGTSGKTAVHIPGIIDDYNHWMLGVDKADQLISYYRPNLRCRRTWMPIMFHALDCMRTNAYIIARSENTRLAHKDFLREWIYVLMTRGHGAAAASGRPSVSTRHRRTADETSPSTVTSKRRRMSNTRPTLPINRFDLRPEDHLPVAGRKAKLCIYCSYEIALSKAIGVEPTRKKPSKTKKKCAYCMVHVCKDHFEVFHDRTTSSAVDA
jgi:hypothetical protein